MKHSLKYNILSQYGFTQWVILVILMLGIGVGVWVAQVRTNLVPQANQLPEPIQSTAMSVKILDNVEINKPFTVAILVRSDVDPVRLVTAHLSFDPQVLEIIKINAHAATGSGVIYATASAEPQNHPQVSEWLEALFDNKTGKVTVTGLFGAGDLKTETTKDPITFVTLTAKAKSLPTNLTIENTSLLLRSIDNANILTKIENSTIDKIIATPSAEPK